MNSDSSQSYDDPTNDMFICEVEIFELAQGMVDADESERHVWFDQMREKVHEWRRADAAATSDAA